MKQDEFIREFNEYFGFEPKAYFCDLSPLEVFGFINHLISKQPSGDIEKIKKIKPDYNHSESYQHGFHDAIQVVLDTMNSPKSKQKPSDVSEEEIELEAEVYENQCCGEGEAPAFESGAKWMRERMKSLSLPLSEVSEEMFRSCFFAGANSRTLIKGDATQLSNFKEEQFNEWMRSKSLSLPTDSKEKEAVKIERILNDDNEPFDNLEQADFLASNYFPDKVIVALKSGDVICETNKCNAMQPNQEYSYFFTLYKEGGTK